MAFILAAYLPQLVGMISVYVPLYLSLMAVLLAFFLQVAFTWLSVAVATSVVMAAVLYLLGGWLWEDFVFNSLDSEVEQGLAAGILPFERGLDTSTTDRSSGRNLSLVLSRLLFENVLQLWLQAGPRSLQVKPCL